MPLGAARLTLLARSSVAVVAEVIRKKVGVSANGNAQVDTAQYQFGGASAYFDGTGDYLLTGSAISLNGTGDFTVECWFRTDDASTSASIIDFRASGSTNPAPIIYFSSANVRWFAAGSDRIVSGTGGTAQTTISTNTWYHLAVVRSSGSTKMYIDGTNVGVTYTDSNNYPSNIATIGENYVLSAPYGGHIEEFRVSNTARYTSGFTPSTTPFVNDDNTKLLLHCDGTDGSTYFDDDNGVGRSAVGVVGNGSIAIDTAQSYFGGSSVLSTGSADSLLFDGSLIPLSGDFTIESWVRFTGTASRKMLYSQYTTGTGRTTMEIDGDEKAQFFCASQGSFSEADRITSDSALSVDTWYHIAVVRDGSNFTMYIDGVAQADTITHSVNVQDQDFEIFGDDLGTHTDDVWQDEFRISDTARYTSGFTPSTTPFVNDSNTLLLLHMNGTDGSTLFLDDNGATRSRVGVTAVNQAQIDTAQSYFGGASALFDGASDYLVTGAPVIPSTGDFTIEFWVRMTDLDTAYFGGQFTGGSAGRFNMAYNNSTDKFQVFWNTGGDVTTTTSTGYSTNTWYHFAISRDGDNLRLFIDGALEATTTGISGATMHQDEFWIGGLNGQAFWTSGNIDEFRISNNARYTAAFTPETTPFQNDANTLLLLHMDGTDGDTDFVDDNGKESA